MIKNAVAQGTLFGRTGKLIVQLVKKEYKTYGLVKKQEQVNALEAMGAQKNEKVTKYFKKPDENFFLEIPKSTEELHQLNHKQVLEVVGKFIFQDVVAAIEKQVINNHYPLNTLNGAYLCNAMEAYKTNLQSGGTPETAKHTMVQNLMDEDKVTSKLVAETIANWLYNTFMNKETSIQVTKEMPLIKWSSTAAVLEFFKANNFTKRSERYNLVKTFGAEFPFVARQETIEKFTQFIINQLREWNNTDRNTHPIPFCAAGTGKSRVNQEMIKNVKRMVREKNVVELLNKHFVDISIIFGNGTKIDDDEMEYLKNATNYTVPLVYRIFHSYFSMDNIVKTEYNFSTYHNYFQKYFLNDCTLTNALELIRAFEDKEEIIVYLGIDEFNELLQYNVYPTITIKPISLLKFYLDTLIGGFMCKPRKDIILVPFFTGTSCKDITSHCNHPPLPLDDLN